MAIDTKKLRKLREAAGLTLQAAAERAGFTLAQQWHLIESDTRPDVRVSTLGHLAKALGVRPEELLIEKVPTKKKSGKK